MSDSRIYGAVYLPAELLISSVGRTRSLIVRDDGSLMLNLTDYNVGMSVEVRFDDAGQLRQFVDRLHDLMHEHDLFEVGA